MSHGRLEGGPEDLKIGRRALLLSQTIGEQVSVCLEARTWGWRTKPLAISRGQEQRKYLQYGRQGSAPNMPGCLCLLFSCIRPFVGLVYTA